MKPKTGIDEMEILHREMNPSFFDRFFNKSKSLIFVYWILVFVVLFILVRIIMNVVRR